jgi:hypothetical protein
VRASCALAAIAAIFATVVGVASAATVPLAPLSTAGDQILRAGAPFAFHGVNRDSLEWGDHNWGGCGGDGHFSDADFDLIAAWHATAVRFPVSEAGWLGRRCASVDYRGLLDTAIAKANARGMYAIIDLHWNDVNGQAPCDAHCTSGQQPMPDSGSVAFWRSVAARYANQPGVIFDLFNEPHGVTWQCWRSGGCRVTSSTPGLLGLHGVAPVTYTAVGMQTLYDAVRGTGAQNVVLAAGLQWAYDLSGVASGYALSGFNIAYDTHIYVHWHSTATDWDAHVGTVAQTYPVTSTELGSLDCSTNLTAPLLQYLNAPMGIATAQVSWTVWSWNAPGQCSQPSLIADWAGTPLPGQGQLIHDTLASYVPSVPAAGAAGAASAPVPVRSSRRSRRSRRSQRRSRSAARHTGHRRHPRPLHPTRSTASRRA